MLIEVKVPQLSESVSEATLVAWHKKEGDAVSRDENLIDIGQSLLLLLLSTVAGAAARTWIPLRIPSFRGPGSWSPIVRRP